MADTIKATAALRFQFDVGLQERIIYFVVLRLQNIIKRFLEVHLFLEEKASGSLVRGKVID